MSQKPKQTMLALMISVAAENHANQYDQGGAPYFLHCLQVMLNLKSKDEELCCIAIGHDLIEDTAITREDLERLGFSKRVIEGIVALTKVDGETYEEYKLKVKSNPDAVRVKMADLQHNTDIRRLKNSANGITKRDIERTENYFKFYLELYQIVNNGEPK